MTTLTACPSCDGFLPPAASSCPHCDAQVTVKTGSPFLSRLARGVLAVAGGGTIALTLMACYGIPPCDEAEDQDGDGFGESCGLGFDCDDDNPDIHQGADDPEGDGVDQNCDGVDGVADEGDGGVGDGGEPDGGELADAGA